MLACSLVVASLFTLLAVWLVSRFHTMSLSTRKRHRSMTMESIFRFCVSMRKAKLASRISGAIVRRSCSVPLLSKALDAWDEVDSGRDFRELESVSACSVF